MLMLVLGPLLSQQLSWFLVFAMKLGWTSEVFIYFSAEKELEFISKWEYAMYNCFFRKQAIFSSLLFWTWLNAISIVFIVCFYKLFPCYILLFSSSCIFLNGLLIHVIHVDYKFWMLCVRVRFWKFYWTGCSNVSLVIQLYLKTFSLFFDLHLSTWCFVVAFHVMQFSLDTFTSFHFSRLPCSKPNNKTWYFN